MTKLTTGKTATRKSEAANPVTTKLTNAQRTFLSLAAQREDGAGVVSEGTTDRAAEKLAAELIEKGLFREVRAKADMPIWRRAEKGRSIALILTKLGRASITAQDRRQPSDTASGAPGLSSGSEAATSLDPAPSHDAAPSHSEQTARSTPRQGTKLAAVIALLSRPDGAKIEDLTSATGWLPHTTRAALTGLRKRGYAVERARSDESGSFYKIVASATPALAA